MLPSHERRRELRAGRVEDAAERAKATHGSDEEGDATGTREGEADGSVVYFEANKDVANQEERRYKCCDCGEVTNSGGP